MASVLFLVVAGGVVGSALVAAFHPEPARAVQGVAAALIGLSMLFVPLGAPWLAAIHGLLLAGAILFALRRVGDDLATGRDPAAGGRRLSRFVIATIAALFAGLVIYLGRRPPAATGVGAEPAAVAGSWPGTGVAESALLPLGIGGLLILVAIVGALLLARAEAPEPAATAMQRAMPIADEDES